MNNSIIQQTPPKIQHKRSLSSPNLGALAKPQEQGQIVVQPGATINVIQPGATINFIQPGTPSAGNELSTVVERPRPLTNRICRVFCCMSPAPYIAITLAWMYSWLGGLSPKEDNTFVQLVKLGSEYNLYKDEYEFIETEKLIHRDLMRWLPTIIGMLVIFSIYAGWNNFAGRFIR